MGCKDADFLFHLVYGSILGFCEQVDEPSVSVSSANLLMSWSGNMEVAVEVVAVYAMKCYGRVEV